MLSSIFVARHLGPEMYGGYIFIMLVLAYFINFGRFRESVSILPYLKNNRAHEKTIFSLGFVLNAIFAAISTLGIVFIGSFFELFDNIAAWIYPLLAVMIFGEYYLIFITYALSFQNKFKHLAGLTAGRAILQMSAFAYLYYFSPHQKVLIPYFIATSGATLVTTLVGAYFIRNYINASFVKYRELNLRLYFKTAALFYISDIATFFSTKGVATFVAGKMAIANLAYFNMMFSHFDLLRFPNSALGTMMFPTLSKESNSKKQRKFIARKIGFNFLIYPPILLAAYFVYPKAVPLFYGNDYVIITQYFPYILAMGAPYLILYPIVHYFSANGVPQYEGFIKLFSLSLQISGVLLILYWNEISLYLAVLVQASGFVGFTIALLLFYRFKNFQTE